MKILFLHSGDRVPTARFRTLPVARRLRRAGHRCTLAGSFPQKYDYFPWLGFRPSQWLKRAVRLWHLFRAWIGRYDLVVIERELFDGPSARMERWFRRVAPAMVLEIDDAVFLRYPDKFPGLARLADHLVVGNRFLAEYFAQYGRGITIIPTCIELDNYPRKQHAATPSEPPIIGWIGTSVNLIYLRVLAPALRRLAQRKPFVLRVVAGDRGPLDTVDLAGVTVEFVRWQASTEVEEILGFDIGVMPLAADEPWTRFKCGLKLLEYMAAGLPAVASPVGVNAEIVRHGENGFLAETDEDWENLLESLLGDPPLRERLGAAARQTVERRYSLAGNVHFYVEAYLRAIAASSPGWSL